MLLNDSDITTKISRNAAATAGGFADSVHVELYHRPTGTVVQCGLYKTVTQNIRRARLMLESAVEAQLLLNEVVAEMEGDPVSDTPAKYVDPYGAP